MIRENDGSSLYRLADSAENPVAVKHSSAVSSWKITYFGFTPEAQAAFQRAVDIWAQHISSPVTIEVQAHFVPMQSEDALGAAGPWDFLLNQERNSYLPWALAEAVAGSEVPNRGAPDIYAEFNSSFDDWYFGLDGQPPLSKWDFVTVVLHELGHGLGFLSSVDQPQAGDPISYGLDTDGRPVPFDRFLITGNGDDILDFASGSAALQDAVLSNNIFFHGLSTLESSGDQLVSIHAPSSWEAGSSVSHLDEAAYPWWNGDSLMTPTIYDSEARHSPGRLTLGVLRDIGWKVYDLLHFPQFADGGGLSSDLVINNPSSTDPMEVTVTVYDVEGNETDPSGFLQNPVTSFQLPPLGTRTLSTRGDSEDLLLGSVIVSSTRPASGVLRFDLPGTGVAGVGSAEPAREVTLPVRRSGALSTGAAIQNPTLEPVTVYGFLLDESGIPVPNGQTAIEIPPHGRIANFINEIFPEAETSSFKGSLLLTAESGSITVIGLELEGGARFTTLPVSTVR